METKGSNPEMQIFEIIWNYTKTVKQNYLFKTFIIIENI